MARPKTSEAVLKERDGRAKEWAEFRKEFLFTQTRLASTLGVSRRTIQMIEAGKVTPRVATQRLFNQLKEKHEAERKG